MILQESQIVINTFHPLFHSATFFFEHNSEREHCDFFKLDIHKIGDFETNLIRFNFFIDIYTSNLFL